MEIHPAQLISADRSRSQYPGYLNSIPFVSGCVHVCVCMNTLGLLESLGDCIDHNQDQLKPSESPVQVSSPLLFFSLSFSSVVRFLPNDTPTTYCISHSYIRLLHCADFRQGQRRLSHEKGTHSFILYLLCFKSLPS